MSGLLKIENLVMVRGTKVAVNGIKLQIAPGRITVLLGPNGAGKTSTVLGISGVVEPAFGEIWMDGVDLKGKEPDEIRRAGIATVPEGHQVLREMSVMDNLRVAGGELSRGDLSAALILTAPPDELLAVHEALDELAREDAAAAELVKLRYFVGMTMEEAASALGLPKRTAENLWTYARVWLHRAIRGRGPAGVP